MSNTVLSGSMWGGSRAVHAVRRSDSGSQDYIRICWQGLGTATYANPVSVAERDISAITCRSCLKAIHQTSDANTGTGEPRDESRTP